ncbi:serine/threonine protein kinase [Kibdelosporangium banguiense]|uniref:Serine/threonine protein kinase n=1 Tax=Kibdelosporangium banguiense TaxID=1365924 RepID=A0ABS4TUC7_9PSEU|nr:protein kinase [Kibdelosporangium banguiense]MBP2328008.1 serine/threonine protein kinase [Kibdelosporangium banguiense]
MSDAAPTRRDAPRGTSSTRRDDVSAGQPPPTRRDDGEPAKTSIDTGGLPKPVFDRYEPVPGGSLGAGGEAHLVMRVRRRTDGADRVVKVYRSTIQPDTKLLEALHTADSAHLVGVDEWGDHTDAYGTSVSWEVLEYVPGGSLRDLMQREGLKLPGSRVRELLIELTEALDYLHSNVVYRGSTGLAHRDVKPANVLIRTEDPLDLVLCDFGLVAEIRATRVSSRRAGTAAYQAPETWWEPSRGPEQDWWSLGVIVVEMLTGRNPNLGSNGEAVDDKVLFEHITTTGGVDLTEVTDPRWRMLCAGLLTMDPTKRWQGDQVKQWLDNKSPKVHTGTAAPRSGRVVAPPIEVAGLPCRTPSEVAGAMSRSFVDACGLFQRRDDRLDLSEWLRTSFPDLAEALPNDLFRKDPADRRDAGTRVARFIAWVAPELRPGYEGRPMDSAGIASLAHDAMTDRDSARLLSQIDARLLRVFGRHRCAAHPGCTNGCAVLTTAADWLEPARQALRRRIDDARRDGMPNLDQRDVATAEALLIRVLVDPDHVATQRTRLGRLRGMDGSAWWTRLLQESGDTPNELAGLALASATEHHVLRQAANDQAVRESARAAEKQEKAVRRGELLRHQGASARMGLRDLFSWSLAMVVFYLGVILAVLVSAVIDERTAMPVPVLIAQAVGLQTVLTVPAAILLGCVLFGPTRPWPAARRAFRIAAFLSGAVAVLRLLGYPQLAIFPVVWQSGVQDLLVRLGSSFGGEGSAAQAPTSVLFGAAIAFALAGWCMVAFARRRRIGDPGPAARTVKRVLIGLVIAMFAARAGQIWLDWHVPGLPTPVSTWLEI